MADGVADVVRECADGEGELICIPGVAEKVDDKISGADVVSEIGKEWIAEGVIADVLNDAAAVGVGASMLDLSGSERGVAREKQRDDGTLPGEVDELLMGEQRISVRGPRRKQGADSQN